ncbi:hypothetical protein EB820_01350 [Brevibacillus agri]|uniref:Uncharacterized protein n=2 Tax=Brevibacillus agri TaxID=51101 RepID=A0A3M8BCZ2_9BACL|nr:hypothetical protein D478_01312 [Brevibacillus agri BAB-2500]QAV15400.1 hypothetical protein BA6348_23090 [Brevibacillus agri]RNB61304.1 hypothetical protein EB820_01350 [Brevibacillus agri]
MIPRALRKLEFAKRGEQMKDLAQTLALLSDQEITLIRKVETCEAYLTIIFAYTEQEGHNYHLVAIEEIMKAVCALQCAWLTDLYHIRLEKAFITNRLQHERGVEQ